MERFTISKSEKQTIFEIYRACRLCGAGGGYRMPIVQNIVDLGSPEVELRKKIEDCLHLEVRPDDRMPPLICELCVDKVNDFYDFLELTRQTNVRTRTRLGLPLQTARRGETDPGDTILGVTEPLCDESKKKSKPGPKCSKSIKQEEEVIDVKGATAGSSRSNLDDNKLYKLLVGNKVEAEASTERVSRESRERGSRESSVSSWCSRTRGTPPRPIRGLRAGAHKNSLLIPEAVEVTKPAKRISNKELSDLLQDQVNRDDNSLLVPRSYKRVREAEPPRPLLIPKRAKMTPKEPTKEPVKLVRIAPKPVKEPSNLVKELAKTAKELTKLVREPPKLIKEPTKLIKVATKLTKEPIKQPVIEANPPPRSKPGPKSKKEQRIPEPLKILKSKVPVMLPKDESTLPKPSLNCIVCKMHLKSPQGVGGHMKSHLPTFTKPQNACNPCGKWFSTVEEAAAHHRYHRSATFPYHCRRCFDDFRELHLYDEHIENQKCEATQALPEVKCERCWKVFPTRPLLQAHKCQGVEGRPGGKCSKCEKTYATIRSLKRHEKVQHRRKRDLIADPDVLRRLKPMQVRISRCDDLLNKTFGDYCDVSRVQPTYGLDKLYFYPYMGTYVKSESLSDRMIQRPIKRELERDYFVHWDSEDSDSDNVINKVDRLSTLSLKKLFSRNMIGKVPRKKRRVKNEAFDTMHDFDSINNDINDIINSLGDDANSFPKDLLGRRMSRNMNEQLRISLNHIIGVPDETTCSDFDMETENVPTIDGRNESPEKSQLETENELSIQNNGTRKYSTEKSEMEQENEVSVMNNKIGNANTEKSDLETESEVSIENNSGRSKSTEKSVSETENLETSDQFSVQNTKIKNEIIEQSDMETENDVSVQKNESTDKSDMGKEIELCVENNEVRNKETEESGLNSENDISIETNVIRDESTIKSDMEVETEVSHDNNDVRNSSTKNSDQDTENELCIQNNKASNEITIKSDISIENNTIRSENTENRYMETENEVSNENNDIRNYSTENSDLETENEPCNKNNDVRNDSTKRSNMETENKISVTEININESTEKSISIPENEVSYENIIIRNESTKISDLETGNEVSIKNNDIIDESTEKSYLESKYEVSTEKDKHESSEDNDLGTESISAKSNKNGSSDSNYLETEKIISNNDVQNDISERDCETRTSDEKDISNGSDNLNNEHLPNAVAEESENNDNSNFRIQCESKELHDTSNDSTNLPLIDIDSQDGLDFKDEKPIRETVEKASSDMEINDLNTQMDRSNYLNNFDFENRREIDENETLRRIDSEAINNLKNSENSATEVSIHNESKEINLEENRINSIEIDYDCKDENKKKNPEDLNSVIHKESPIKHSIESLIGDTDKNPDKYIKEVISSIEDIIMKNPRNEETFGEIENGEEELHVDDIDDQNLMDALDAQIGEDKNCNDKITLADLLPQEERPVELDDIAEDDFNFDT